MAINRDEDGRFESVARALAELPRPRKTRIADSIDEGFDSLGMDPYFDREDDDEYVDNRMYVRDYARPSGGVPGYGGNEAGLSFWAPLHDLGDGVVDIRAYAGPHNGQQGTFTRATVASCRLASGLLKKVASGVPRSHYLASGEYGGYLAEGARTNLARRSEEADNASWSKLNATVAANAAVAPDGTLTADKIIADASSNQHGIHQTATVVADSPCTQSVFAKAGEYSWLFMTEANNVTAQASFNLATGAVGTVSGTGSPSATIEPWGDGWYRCTLTFTPIATSANIQVRPQTDNGGSSYLGDGTSGIYAWGMQMEQAAFASSYIPTTTASVPRNADVLTYPSQGNSNGATRGTAYAELSTIGWTVASQVTADSAIAIGANAAFQASPMRWTASAVSTELLCADGTGNADKQGLTDLSTGVRKRASSWGALGLRATGDGAAVATGAFDGDMGTAIGVGNSGAGDRQFYGTLKNVRFWDNQLPDAMLQSLTA